MHVAGVAQVKTNVEISFFEIYNEKIHDLLGPSASKDKLQMKRPTVISTVELAGEQSDLIDTGY